MNKNGLISDELNRKTLILKSVKIGKDWAASEMGGIRNVEY